MTDDTGPLQIEILPDELDILYKLFSDEHKNHQLHRIIKTYQIFRSRIPTSYGNLPSLRIFFAQSRSIEFNKEEEDEETGLVYHYNSYEQIIGLEIIVDENQHFTYNGKTYKGVEETIPLITQIVERILSENTMIEYSELRGTTIDDIEVLQKVIIPAYAGDGSIFAVRYSLLVISEKEQL